MIDDVVFLTCIMLHSHRRTPAPGGSKLPSAKPWILSSVVGRSCFMLLSKQVRTVSLKPQQGRISGPRLPDLPLRHFQDQLFSVLCHCHVPDPATSTVAGKLQQPLTSSQTAVCPPFLPPALDGHTSSVTSDDPGVRAAAHAVAHATLPHQPLLTSLPPLTPCSPPHPEFRLHQPCFPQTSPAPPQGHSPCFVVCL